MQSSIRSKWNISVKCRNPVCTREATPWLWFLPGQSHRQHVAVPTCSLTCLSIVTERKLMLEEPTEVEAKGLAAASDLGGGYLESVGKTDLAKLTPEQWQEFVSTVCGGFVSAVNNARHDEAMVYLADTARQAQQNAKRAA